MKKNQSITDILRTILTDIDKEMAHLHQKKKETTEALIKTSKYKIGQKVRIPNPDYKPKSKEPKTIDTKIVDITVRPVTHKLIYTTQWRDKNSSAWCWEEHELTAIPKS